MSYQKIILLSGRMRALNYLARNHPEEYEELLYKGIKEAELSMNTRRKTNE